MEPVLTDSDPQPSKNSLDPFTLPRGAGTADLWTMKTNVFEPGYEEEVANLDERWSLLAPFFESHGYYLYSMAPGTHGFTLLPPQQVLSSKEKDPLNPYPYARRVYEDEIEVIFGAEPVCPFLYLHALWLNHLSETATTACA